MSTDTGGQEVIGVGPDDNPAVNLVRAKLQAIYFDEPSAIEEEKEIASLGPRSKHQEFMESLMQSNKSLVDIQTSWHEYYQSLGDAEKHEVWQEFYEQHAKAPAQSKPLEPSTVVTDLPVLNTQTPEKHTQSMSELHKKLLNTVNANGKLKAKHHIKSVAFSLAFASLITGVLFFITNNERFITPFIQPTKSVAAAPLITDGSKVGPETKIIIPKLNLEAPIVTSVSDNAEKVLQEALELGVVQYPGTPNPGELGNFVVFGHSSSNLFNRGAHKFVFVRLHQLEVGDTYAINYNGVQYVYRVIIREVVKPTEVSVLYRQPEGKPAVSTLITCDPPGTANNRLIIVGEQISPSPTGNVASAVAKPSETDQAKEIPSNAPSLLSRLFGLELIR
jgi:LPXTG-site transpeptidase (sortase) family protein